MNAAARKLTFSLNACGGCTDGTFRNMADHLNGTATLGVGVRAYQKLRCRGFPNMVYGSFYFPLCKHRYIPKCVCLCTSYLSCK